MTLEHLAFVGIGVGFLLVLMLLLALFNLLNKRALSKAFENHEVKETKLYEALGEKIGAYHAGTTNDLATLTVLVQGVVQKHGELASRMDDVEKRLRGLETSLKKATP